MISIIFSRLAIGLLKGFARLPYRLVAQIGEAIGALLYLLPSKRKQITRRNLALCFPNLDAAEREIMARKTFQYVIRSFTERGIIWAGSVERLQTLVKVVAPVGFDWHNLQKPRIILSMHMTGMEAGALMISYQTQPRALSYYMPMSNKVFDQFAFISRLRYGGVLLPRSDNALPLMKYLKRLYTSIFLVDMDFGRKGAEFVDFFGIPACTITSVARLAKATGAEVIPAACIMRPNYQGYELALYEPLPNFGQNDLLFDLRAMNQFFEKIILQNPEQYYWVHRRFKTRPIIDGVQQNDLYT